MPAIEKSGAKKDDGKLRFDLLPSDALEEIAFVYTIGAKKYADRNWEQGIKWGRVFAATMRHAWAYWRGERYDRECLNSKCIDPVTNKHTYIEQKASDDRYLACHLCGTGGTRQYHLASVAWGAITLLAYDIRGLVAFDDRGKYG